MYKVKDPIEKMYRNLGGLFNQPTKRQIRKYKNKNWKFISKHTFTDPFADTDRDGKFNFLDCKPFNRRKHGLQQQAESGLRRITQDNNNQ